MPRTIRYCMYDVCTDTIEVSRGAAAETLHVIHDGQSTYDPISRAPCISMSTGTPWSLSELTRATSRPSVCAWWRSLSTWGRLRWCLFFAFLLSKAPFGQAGCKCSRAADRSSETRKARMGRQLTRSIGAASVGDADSTGDEQLNSGEAAQRLLQLSSPWHRDCLGR